MKQYFGQRRDDGSVRVVVRDCPLAGGRFAESEDIASSDLQPTRDGATTDAATTVTVGPSFDWGIETPASISLARAILSDCLGPDEAEEVCAEFEWSILRGLPERDWQLGESEVRAFRALVPGLRLARALETRTFSALTPPAGVPAFNPFDSSTWSDPAGFIH